MDTEIPSSSTSSSPLMTRLDDVHLLSSLGDDDPFGKKLNYELRKVISFPEGWSKEWLSFALLSKESASTEPFLDELSDTVLGFGGLGKTSLAKLVYQKIQDIESRTVVPIFYGVDPCDVKNQTGPFKEHFDRYEEKYKDNPDKVQRWRNACKEAAGLSGWTSKGRSESELINEIVKDVWQKLHPTEPFPSSPPPAPPPPPPPLLPSPPPSPPQRKHDVFISFRGPDTRLNFLSHLCTALVAWGISVFTDKNLKIGESISSGLRKAIKLSLIFIVLLSPNFASSKWCLDELSEVLPFTNNASMPMEETIGIPNTFGQHEVRLDNTGKVEELKPPLTRNSCNLRLLINYNGRWANSVYTGGKTKGILISEETTYEELKDQAYRIVRVDPQEHNIIMKAKYVAEHPTEPTEITDDDDVKYFIMESLSPDTSCRIPLCITLEQRKHACERQKKIWNPFTNLLFSVFCIFSFLLSLCLAL